MRLSPQATSVIRLNCISLFNMGPKLDNRFKPSFSYQNPDCAFGCIHCCTLIFQAIIYAGYHSWSLGQNLRDRDRDFEQKLETKPRLKRSDTETRHETFETKRLQYFANIFETKFWTFGKFPNTLQYTGWAKKMLPLLIHTQILKMNIYSNFFLTDV